MSIIPELSKSWRRRWRSIRPFSPWRLCVTLVALLRRQLPTREAVLFVAVQLAAGTIGVLAAHAMFEVPVMQLSVKARTGTGQWLGEFIATFALILTILGTLRHRPAAVPA